MIDLYTFLIIKPELLDLLIDKIGSSLTISSDIYVITLLIANLVAYIVIYLVYKIAMTIYYALVPRDIRRYKVL